ncbi:tetratricopeptide repeat protein [Vitellibacter sp. q18]|nr:tetratricopeptide repeat protein [Aequorivita lutea]
MVRWVFIGILIISLGSQTFFAQEPIAKFVDSLAAATSVSEKSRLSLKIANSLADVDWNRARNYLDLAKENASQTKDPKVLADYYMAVAQIYSNKDALDIALENYLKAYEYYQNRPEEERLKIENNLAIVYARTENSEKALKFFRKIYNYNQTQKNDVHYASVANNMGRIWLDENPDSALVYFNKSLEIARNLDKPDLKLLLYTNVGKAYMKLNEPIAAKKSFDSAQAVGAKSIHRQNKAWLYNELSEYFRNLKMNDSALYYSEMAVATFDSVAPFGFEQQRAVALLYKTYLSRNEFEKAAAYFEKYVAITDTLNLEDKRVNVEKLLIAEEYRNKEKIRELEDSKRQSRNYIILLVLLAILLVLGFFLYRFRNKLKRVNLEKQLAFAKEKELSANLQLRNKELIGKAMIEMHRTEIIEDILGDLKKVKLRAAKKETQDAIDYIAKRLKRDTATNIWEEFEMRFEQVHESFYKNLLAKHPDLTTREKRLAALLKLNLTSKEIAQITGQTSKSVENARTRLRKKLEITNSQTDLSAYLTNFG